MSPPVLSGLHEDLPRLEASDLVQRGPPARTFAPAFDQTDIGQRHAMLVPVLQPVSADSIVAGERSLIAIADAEA
jgi:hypothetical protein